MRRLFDFWHPSNGRLRAWLETGEPDGVGIHVEQCDRCADRLVQLDHDEGDAGEPLASPLRQALATMLTPPDDLGARVLHGIERRTRAEEELMLFAGLFSIGVETAQLMFDPGTEQDQPETDDTARAPERDDEEDDR